MLAREDARKISYEQGNGDDLIIDEIYDSIGTCVECAYWNSIGACTKQHFSFLTYDDYYCADFERTEDAS